MICNSVTIPMTRGSNLAFPMTLKDQAGAVVNVTGWTFSVVEVSPASLAEAFTCSVTDGINGKMMLAAQWSSAWPKGIGALVSVRLKPSGMNEAFPAIVVDLK